MRFLALWMACISVLAHADEEGLIDPAFITDNLTREAYWSPLHAAYGQDLGAGMLYYGLVYATKAKLCVCLGSGDGFVPRVLRQAQRDLHLPDSKTILVDGNIGPFGRPMWLKNGSFFRQRYPEIEIILDTTSNVAKAQAKDWNIDYLHIDADRAHVWGLAGFPRLSSLYVARWNHYLARCLDHRPCAKTAILIAEMGYPVINLETLGTGTAIIRLKSNKE